MSEPFKNLLDAALVRNAATHLHGHWRGFDRARFEALALNGLETLELKARAMRIADALEATLPDDFDRAAGLIEASSGRKGKATNGRACKVVMAWSAGSAGRSASTSRDAARAIPNAASRPCIS